MKNIKTTLLSLLMAITFALSSTAVCAEEAVGGTSEILSRIDSALLEISKSDFSAAQVQLKAARTASEHIAGNSDAAKQAHAILIQGQISAKKGDIAKSTAELNKAKEIYKSL